MFDNDLVSIIIPCFNSEKTIQRTIVSVLNQSYKNIEVVIVDDGSIDNTSKVINKFNDYRIKYIHQKNLGVSQARNNGLSKANGEYIAFLDSDDVYYEDFVGKCMEVFSIRQDVSIVASRIKRIDEKGNEEVIGRHIVPLNNQVTIHDYFDLFTNGNVLSMSSIIVKKKYINLPRAFNVDYMSGEDHEFYASVAFKCSKLALINEVLANYYSSSNFRQPVYPAAAIYIDNNKDELVQSKRVKANQVKMKYIMDYINRLLMIDRQKEARKIIKENIYILKENKFRYKLCIYIVLSYIPIKLNIMEKINKFKDKYRKIKIGD